MKSTVVLLSIAVSSTGCATLKFSPGAYEKKSFALATLYGQRSINAGTGLIGAVQGGTAEWGRELLEENAEDVARKLAATTGGEYTPAEAVVAAAAYQAAPAASFEAQQAAPKGLRALSLEPTSDAALGLLASQLHVDAVVLVSNQWNIRNESSQSSTQVCDDTFEVAVVGADGQRLWSQTEYTDATAELSMGNLLSASVGAVQGDAAKQMCLDAMRRGLDRFASAWKSNRK